MDKIKVLNENLSRFSGSHIDEWLDRFEMICSLYKISSKEAVLPFLLEGDAYAVYKSLKDVKEDFSYDELKSLLIEVFGISKETAFTTLCRKKLNPGDNVDVHVNELKNLIKQSGDFLKCFFVASLPEKYANEIRKNYDVDFKDMVRTVRNMSKETTEINVSAVSRQEAKKRCYACNKSDHFLRDCKMKNLITCAKCNRKGHNSMNCRAGKDNGTMNM